MSREYNIIREGEGRLFSLNRNYEVFAVRGTDITYLATTSGTDLNRVVEQRRTLSSGQRGFSLAFTPVEALN